jgi:hypothetical protein
MRRAMTRNEWRAIREALAERLAGAIETNDDDDPHMPTRRDYETAFAKVKDRLDN